MEVCRVQGHVPFGKREMELTEDILAYQEENSRIRGIIKYLKQERKC